MKAFKKSVIARGKSLYKYVTVPVFKQTDMKSLIQLFIKNLNEYAVCMQDKIKCMVAHFYKDKQIIIIV